MEKRKKAFYDLQGLKQGNRAEFEALYFEMFDTLFYLALSYVKDNEVAEDLVQDSFLQLWSNRKNLNEDTHLLNYLYTITKNKCLNHLKHIEVKDRYIQKASIAEIKFLQESLNSLPDSYSELMALKQDLEKAVNSLPEDVREIFLLNRFSDMTYARIAEKKSISVKTVEAKMTRAIKKLKDVLKEYYPLIMFFYYLNKV